MHLFAYGTLMCAELLQGDIRLQPTNPGPGHPPGVYPSGHSGGELSRGLSRYRWPGAGLSVPGSAGFGLGIP